jgi:hydroxymethylglutaryl-CoA lyase
MPSLQSDPPPDTPPAPSAAAPRARPVSLRDVSLRDGLQSLARTVPTATKLSWLDGLHAAGLRAVEVGSFVPAKLMPQLADTAAVVAHARTLPGLDVTVLVPNLRGAVDAFASGADALLLPISASHAHSLANLRRTPDEAVAELARIRAARDAAGARCRLEVGISTAFGCTIQGEVAESEVLRLVQAALDAGAERIGLADTVGYANPLQVGRLFERAVAVAGERLDCGHFHDTRGLGAANAYAAWAAGARHFDASAGGIGGCPHAPGASGNVATEDLAWLFAAMGVPTGIDFDALMALRGRIAGWIEGDPLHGAIWRAGLPKTLRPAGA